MLEQARRERERQYLREIIAALVERKDGGRISSPAFAALLRIFLGGRMPRKADIAVVMADLGGYSDRTCNRREWAGVALRPRAADQAKRSLQRLWDQRLAGEHLEADDRPRPPGSETRPRKNINGGVFEKANEYLWTNQWENQLERECWEMFAVGGLSIRKISSHVGRSKSWVGNVFTKHKARCGLLY